jgi:integrase
MPFTRQRYQNGSLVKVKRAAGPKVWVYRWREVNDEGRRVQRKAVIGTVEKYKTDRDAWMAVESRRLQVNADVPLTRPDEVLTFAQLWGHFQDHELYSIEADRSQTTIDLYLDNTRLYLIPQWGEMPIGQIKTVAVEQWLSTLKGQDRKRKSDGSIWKKGGVLAPSVKAKLRNQMGAIYSHAIRHELYDRNPISGSATTEGKRGSGGVRQSSQRLRTPDILTLDEMKDTLIRVKPPILVVAVKLAAVTGFRRSEIRGLKWAELDVPNLWLNVKRGIVRSAETKAKSAASRRGVPISPALVQVLLEWRKQSLYRADGDWIFASERKGGRTPIWLDVALEDHIRPAAKQAGIKKQIGWHTFRRSLATIVAAKTKDMKVAQELLRHANSGITADLYAQGDVEAQRAAQAYVADLLLVVSTEAAPSGLDKVA